MMSSKRAKHPRRMQLETLEARHLLSVSPWVPPSSSPKIDCFEVPVEFRAAMAMESSSPIGAPFGASSSDTSEYMLGDVWVTVVLLESNGQIDPNIENWTTTEIAQVKSEIVEGLTWWESMLKARYPKMPLKFHVDFTHADSPVPTKYEPITRPYHDQSLWIDEFLTYAGANTPANYFTDMFLWNNNQRNLNNCDWAFTVFVVDSSMDADGMFADGYFAYAYLGGPFTVMTYDNNGWGISRMGQVLAHEMGHIFHALDEYPGAGSYYDRSGYYNIQNTNAYDNHPQPWTRVNSIMAESNLQIPAYAQGTSSPQSLQAIGWRDSDGNGILDVVDRPHTLAGTMVHDAIARTLTFTGSSAVQTLANQNPRGNRSNITINTIDYVEYRIDGGPWTRGNALTGGHSAGVSQVVNLPSAGSHLVEIRTVCERTSVTSVPVSYQVVNSLPNLRDTGNAGSGFEPNVAQTGDAFSLWFTIENNGTYAANTPFLVDFYLSTDATITPADTKLGSVTVSGLAVGQTQVVRLDVPSLPYLDKGYYYAGCIIDPTGVVLEQNEQDNRGVHTARTVEILSPTARASISGYVFHDANGDGARLPDEPGIEGIQVYLDLNGNGQYDPPHPTSYIVTSRTPVAIPDAGQVESVLQVSQSGRIADLKVMLDITHTFTADLDIWLVSPFGLTVALIQDAGGGGKNFSGTILDDAAEIAIRDGQAPFTGRYRPEQPLSTFAGHEIQGAWTLRVADDTLTDIGRLESWSIEFFLADEAEPITTTDANGYYEFKHLEAGSYIVRQIDQPGWTPIERPGGTSHTVFLATNEQRTDVHFPNQSYPLTGTVTGHVWNDVNADGQRDADERGFAEWYVYADLNGNGQWDPTPESLVRHEVAPYLPIPDLDTVTSTIHVTESGTILDLNVMLDITHWWTADLDVMLVAPNGQSIVLFEDVGGSGRNFTGTILDDEASQSITAGRAPFTGTFRPQQPLSTFDGLDMQGVWTLVVTDDRLVATGVLNRWGLEFTRPRTPEPFAVTDADGYYELTGLEPGEYVIRVVPQGDWLSTASPGDAHTVQVVAGHTVPEKDFGLRRPTAQDVVYRAVVVGVSDYVGTANDLPYAAGDAVAFRDALLTDARWSSDRIMLLTDSEATKSAVAAALAAVAAESDANDVFVFYFAGRGLQGTSDLPPLDEPDWKDEYLVPYHETASLGNYIRDDELADWLNAITADRILVLLDAETGSGVAEDLVRPIGTHPQRTPSTVVLAACAAGETAWGHAEQGHSLFTYHLLQAMNGLAGDANRDGALSLEEAYAYVAPRVTAARPNQRPQLFDNYEGNANFLGAPSHRLYVDRNAAPGGDGFTWDSAFQSLDAALTLAASLNTDTTFTNDIVDIWIADGAYLPTTRVTPDDPRSAVFSLVSDVTLVGGFVGGEMSIDERGRDAAGKLLHPTILSGDLGIVGDTSDNAYTVLFAYGVRDAALDGVQVRDAMADGTHSLHAVLQHESCGALYAYDSTLVLRDVEFFDNYASQYGAAIRARESTHLVVRDGTFHDNSVLSSGGAISVEDSFADLSGSTFLRNVSGSYGGAVDLVRSTGIVTQCRFEGNRAIGGQDAAGGAIQCLLSELNVVNSTFVNNSAVARGGAIWVQGHHAVATITHATFTGNQAADGGGIYREPGTTLRLYNTIVSGNTSSTNRDVGGSFAGSGNLIGSTEPLFVRAPGAGADGLLGTLDDDYGDLRLLPGCAAFNRGDNSVVPRDIHDLDGDGNRDEWLPIDLDGRPRIAGSRVDIGAYEADAPGLYVTTAEDVIADDGLLSLREALLLAAARPGHDAIYFDMSLFGATIALNPSLGELLLDSEVTIQGPHASLLTIDAGGAGRALSLHAAIDCQVSSITIQGGVVAGLGGGVLVTSGSLVLDAVVLADNHAASGGALAATGGASVELIACQILKNGALLGGGIFASDDGTRFQFKNCLVQENTAVQGAGIAAVAGAVVLGTDNTLAENAATNNGGAVFAMGQSTRVELLASSGGNQLLSNTAGSHGGGGMAVEGATLRVVGGVVRGDAANGRASSHSGGGFAAYRGGHVELDGVAVTDHLVEFGALYAAKDGAALLLDNVAVRDNQAQSGGGVHAAAGAVVATQNATFQNNTAAFHGGAMVLRGADTTATISATHFLDNTAAMLGGSLYMTAGAVADVDDSVFSGSALLATGQRGAQMGAGVALQNGGLLRIRETEFADLVASLGGGVYVGQNGKTPSVVQLEDVRILNCIAQNHGGGVYAAQGAILEAERSLIEANSAEKGGGGVFAVGAGTRIRLIDTALRDNSAHTGGGAQINSGASLHLVRSTVTGNTASIQGGGLWIAATATADADSALATRIADNISLRGIDADVVGRIDFLAGTGGLPAEPSFGDEIATPDPDTTDPSAVDSAFADLN